MNRHWVVPPGTLGERQMALAGLATFAFLTLGACASGSYQDSPRAVDSSAAAPNASAVSIEASLDVRPNSDVPPFSSAATGESIPRGWENWVLHPRKKATRYEIVVESGKAVLRAHAIASASGLLARVNADPTETPFIEWSWRTESLLGQADNLVAALEDSPARVVLAFEGDRTSLPLKDQLFFERVKLFTGVDLPYATLMYIWGNRRPIESVLQNPHTPRIQKIVVSSGAAGVNRWHRMRRNIIDDYRRAFGKSPGRLVGVAVMSDSDNTNGDVVAYYGDIRLLPGGADLKSPAPHAAERDDRLDRMEFGG